MLSNSFYLTFKQETLSLSNLLDILKKFEEEIYLIEEELIVLTFRPITKTKKIKLLVNDSSLINNLATIIKTNFQQPIKTLDVLICFLLPLKDLFHKEILSELYAISLDNRILRMHNQIPLPKTIYCTSYTRLLQHKIACWLYFNTDFPYQDNEFIDIEFIKRTFKKLNFQMLKAFMDLEKQLQDEILFNAKNLVILWDFISQLKEEQLKLISKKNWQQLIDSIFLNAEIKNIKLKNTFTILAYFQECFKTKFNSPSITKLLTQKAFLEKAEVLDKLIGCYEF